MLIIELTGWHADGLPKELLDTVDTLRIVLDVGREGDRSAVRIETDSESLREAVTFELRTSLGLKSLVEPVSARRLCRIVGDSSFIRFRPRILENDVEYDELPPGVLG